MKKLILVLLLLTLTPACASAWEMQHEKNYITFPELDNMKAHFTDKDEWVIVTPENFEEHMELLLARGDTEEAVRARFAEESMLWEAYWHRLPEDACIRVERFETAHTREIWRIKTLSTKARRKLVEQVGEGKALEKYQTYSCKDIKGNGNGQYIECSFTTWPPAAHESGAMHIYYVNGKAYVMTYNVLDRMAGRLSLRSHKENDLVFYESPFYPMLRFNPEKVLPKQPDFRLDDIFPMQADLGEIIVKGAVTKGATLTVTLDGEEIPCKVTSKGAFTVTLPLDTPGEHEVAFTAAHKKYTDRTETFTVHASSNRTPLKMTELPEDIATAGKITIAGESAPGAAVSLALDDEEPIVLTADENGLFTCTVEALGDRGHLLVITASSDGRDDSVMHLPFLTEYETFKDGVKAFQKKLTKHTIGEMAKDPESYVGERVKISVVIKEITYTAEGLGVLCTYNPPSGTRYAKTPLYLTLCGYAEDQLQKGMITTVYGTVRGLKELEGESRMEILVQYGTYLVKRKK